MSKRCRLATVSIQQKFNTTFYIYNLQHSDKGEVIHLVLHYLILKTSIEKQRQNDVPERLC